MRRTPMKPRTKPMSRGASLVSTARLERRSRIKPRSDKTARIYVTRRALVAEMFLYPEVCEVPWCSNVATDPHEPLTQGTAGRHPRSLQHPQGVPSVQRHVRRQGGALDVLPRILGSFLGGV